jgi:chromosome segregation ATPase
MPTKKAASRLDPAARQLKQLRATIQQLRTKLAQEVKRRKLDVRMLEEAKRARAGVTQQMTALRAQGQKLAQQVKKAVGDANSREQARKEAAAMVKELRTELRSKANELRQKSVELEKLVKESIGRAREIVHHEAPSAHIPEAPPSEPPEPPETGSAGPEDMPEN